MQYNILLPLLLFPTIAAIGSQSCSAPKSNFSLHASCFNYWNKGDPVVVTVGLHVEAISAVKGGSMDFDVDLKLDQSWVDWHMEHNSSDPITVSDPCIQGQFWLPDLYFANAKRAAFQTVTKPNKLFMVYPDGSVHYSSRILVTISCNQDLRNYPMDQQECRVMLKSYGHPSTQITLEWFDIGPVSYNPDIQLPEMELQEIVAEECGSDSTYGRTKTQRMEGTFSCLLARMRLRRQIGYHLVQTYIPTSLIVAISWLSFWIDPTAVPARITLSFTTLLTLSTMAAGLRTSLPPVSYAKAIDYWVGLCTIFIVLALLEFALINTILRHASKMTEMKHSSSTSAVLPLSQEEETPAAKPLLNPERGEAGGEDENLNDLKDRSRRLKGRARRLRELAYAVDEVSRYLFPFAFFLAIVIYFVLFSR